MPRLHTLLHLGTALLLAMQMARGGVDMLMCLHEDEIHLTSAHPECCDDACADDTVPIDTPALGHQECACLDIPLQGHEDATPVSSPVHSVPSVPLLALPADATQTVTATPASAPSANPPCFNSLQPLLRRSVELRI